MNGWLIYREEDSKRNQSAIRLFLESAEALGIRLELKIYENLMAGDVSETLYLAENAPDFVINRSRDYRLGAWFEAGQSNPADVPFSNRKASGIRVFNSSEVTRICNDKALTLEFAEQLGIPVLPWALGEKWLTPELTYPLVAKSCDGHGGTEVFWADSFADIKEIHRKFAGKKWLIQQAASEPGKDVRVYVLGGRIVKAMLRHSETDFRSNYCLGGSVREYELSEEERQIAEKLAGELRLDYAGIDFLFHEGHPVLNEVEDVVGARMLYAHTDVHIIEAYMEYIWRQMGGTSDCG